MNTSKSFTIQRQLQPYLLTTLIACLSVCCGCQSIAFNDTGYGGIVPRVSQQPKESLASLVKHKLMDPVDTASRQAPVQPKRQNYRVQQQPLSNKVADGFSKLLELPRSSQEKTHQPRNQSQRQASRKSKRQVNPEVALVNYEITDRAEISRSRTPQRRGQRNSQIKKPASDKIAAGFSKLRELPKSFQEKTHQLRSQNQRQASRKSKRQVNPAVALANHEIAERADMAMSRTPQRRGHRNSQVQQPTSDKIAAGISKLRELPRSIQEKMHQPRSQSQMQASRKSKRQVNPAVALVNYEVADRTGISMPRTPRRTGQQFSQIQTPASTKIAAGFSKLFRSSRNSQETPQQSLVAQPRHSNQVQAARQMEQQGNLNEAMGIYETAIRGGNSSPIVLQRLAVLYDKTGQAELAMPLYQRALEMNPDNAELLCDFGFHLFLKGNLYEPEQLYLRALNASPNHARAHNNLGVLLAQLNRQEEAMEQFMIAGLNHDQAQHNMSVAVSQIQNIQVTQNTGRQPVQANFSDY